MIRAVIDFSLKNQFVVVLAAVLLAGENARVVVDRVKEKMEGIRKSLPAWTRGRPTRR